MFQVIEAQPEDLKTLAAYSNRYKTAELEKLLNKDFVKIYVLKSGMNILGFAVIWLLEKEAELHWFEIFEPFRGLGLSKLFMESLEEDLIGKGAEKILLEVSENNKKALKVYEKSGFKKVGVRREYYPDGSDALLMEKYLKAL